MSKRGKADLVADDKADSPAPVRRSTRISLGQILVSSPAPMVIKSRRGSANSSSEEKITVEANSSPKEKRKTRRTSTDEDPKPAPIRSRRSSVSKVIEEEKTSIPNSPGRRSTRLSSSSPSLDAPARRTRRSSQDTETVVEIPARRTTRRSSTGIQESTIEEIVEKAKPITRRRRSSSIDEQEENTKTESARPKTKRLFNEDNHLEPIKEQEQEMKEKNVVEEKQETVQKLEVIEETHDIESEKIIEDLNEALGEKSSPNKSISESKEIGENNTEINNEKVTERNETTDEKNVESSNELLNKTVDKESVNEEKEKSLTKDLTLEKEENRAEDTASKEEPSIEKSNNDVTDDTDNQVEIPTLQQKNILEISEDVSNTVTLNESCDKNKLEKNDISSPGSDKENTSINIKKKRLSIKKLEENSNNEIADNVHVTKSAPNNSLCEPMDVDNDEDDIFTAQAPMKNPTPKRLSLCGNIGEENKKIESNESEVEVQNAQAPMKNQTPKRLSLGRNIGEENKKIESNESEVAVQNAQAPMKNQTPKRLSLCGNIGEENKKIESYESEVAVQNGHVVDMNSSIKEDYSTMEGSFTHVNSSPDIEPSLLVDESQKNRLSLTFSTLSENKHPLSDNIGEKEIEDDCESEASIKLVDTDDEEEAAKLSTEKEDQTAITPGTPSEQTLVVPDSEFINESIKLVDTDAVDDAAEISTKNEEKDKSITTAETSTNQTPIVLNSELIEASVKPVGTDDEAAEISTEKEKDESMNPDSELNESIFDKSFESTKNNSLTEEHVKTNEDIASTDSEQESRHQLNSEEIEVLNSNDETITSVVPQENSISQESKKPCEEESKTLELEADTESIADFEENTHEFKEGTIESSINISLRSTSAQNENASLEAVNITDGEHIKVSEDAPQKPEKADSRKSLQESEEGKKDSDDTESINNSYIQEIPESVAENNDSKVDRSLRNSDKEPEDELEIETDTMEGHKMNIPKTREEWNGGEVEEANESLLTESTLELNTSNEKIYREETLMNEKLTTPLKSKDTNIKDDDKLEKHESNISKTYTSPCKKIILQKIEVLDIEIQKINLPVPSVQDNTHENDKSGNQEQNQIAEKSSVKRLSTRHSLSSDLIKNGNSEAEELNLKSPNERELNTRNSLPNRTIKHDKNAGNEQEDGNIVSPNSSKWNKHSLINRNEDKQQNISEPSPSKSPITIPIETIESEDEIHLITSSDDEDLVTVTIENSTPIIKRNDARNSKEKTDLEDDQISEKKIESSTRKSLEIENSSLTDDICTSRKRASNGSGGKAKKMRVDPEEATGNENKKEEIQHTTSENEKERIEKLHRSGIHVEDEESSIDEHHALGGFIDDMAEEVTDTLSEEESDENEIKDVGESVLSSDTNEEISGDDDYDLNDSFIDNDEQEEVLLSGVEHFLEEKKNEKPKKNKFKRIISPSTSTSDEEEIIDQIGKSTEASKNFVADSPQVEKKGQVKETPQINNDKFVGIIDSILKPNPGECSTPNQSIPVAMNESQITESSVILQETCSVGAARSKVIIHKIQGVVDVFCKNITEPEGDISLNVSLNYKPPSSSNSARNSLNMSFGTKDLNQSINNLSNQSARQSLNEKKNETSISPRTLVNEIVKIENEVQKAAQENEPLVKVEEETKVSLKKKKPRRKKSKKEKESSLERKEPMTEESNLSKQKTSNKSRADQENEQKQIKTSQTKQKTKEVKATAEVHSPPIKKKKHNDHTEIKNRNIRLATATCDKISPEESVEKTSLRSKPKVVESNNTKGTKNQIEQKSKRARDVSEPTLGRKKIKHDESGESKNIVSRGLQPELKKELKSEKHESTQKRDNKRKRENHELLSSKTNKHDEIQSQFKTTNIKEIRPKNSRKCQTESKSVGSSFGEFKISNENEHNEWDEENIFIKPSAANSTKSGFNLETYVESDFKNRMIYDSLRNKREPSAKSRSKKKSLK